MPRLTVLMPVRNGEEYVRRAVTSTLRALPADAELLVANDGSVDLTAQILSTIDDRRLNVYGWDVSLGVSKSLNELLQKSDSKYVARMDADDVCLPFRFSHQQPMMESYDCTFSNAVLITSRGLPYRTDRIGEITPDAMPLHLLIGNMLFHPTMFAKRTMIESLRGYRETAAEDYDMWLRASASGKRMYRSPLPVILYRKHRAQISKAMNWGRPDWEPILDSAYAHLAELMLELDLKDNALRLYGSTGNPSLVDASVLSEFSLRIRRRAQALAPGQKRLLLERLNRQQRRAKVTANPETQKKNRL